MNMNRLTLISNLAWRIHEIANYQAVKEYELKYAILDAEPAIYYGALYIPREKRTDATKMFIAMYERKYKK